MAITTTKISVIHEGSPQPTNTGMGPMKITTPPAPIGGAIAPCNMPANMSTAPTAMTIKAILLRLILDHQHDKEDYDPEDE